MHGPLFAIGEVGFRHFAQDNASKPTGNIKAGRFYTGGTQYTVTSGVLKPVHGLYGLYALGDHQLWRLRAPSGSPRAEAELSRWGDAEHQRHVSVFASVVVVPEPRTKVMPYFFNVGAVSYGLNPGRPRDFFSVGLAYGSNGRGPIPLAPISTSGQTAFPVPPNEQTLEVNYGFTVRPGLVLQPSLQYILNPKGLVSIPNELPSGAPVPNALALGINTAINF